MAKQDYLDILSFQKPRDTMVMENMNFWPETIELYRKSTHGEELNRHFGLQEQYVLPIDFNFVPAFPEKILEETNEYIVKTDCTNTTLKVFKNSSAMPHYIQFPIETREDFLALKPRLDAACASRYPIDFVKQVELARSSRYVSGLVTRGVFAFLRDFIDFNRLMMLFYDDPEFIREMIDFHTEFVIKLWSRALDMFVPDYCYLGEDMAYKSGTMISPDMIRAFILPSWKKIIGYLKLHGVKNIILDSDGNIEGILDMVVEAGFTCILPVERTANMDGEKVRAKYPRLGIIGGVDKLAIARGKEQIDDEVAKAVRLYQMGGYIPSFDHSVPPIVSYENYRYYIDTLRMELGKIR